MKLIVEPADHEALAAAEKLRSYCDQADACSRCIFSYGQCMLRRDNPDEWDLSRVYDILAKGGKG